MRPHALNTPSLFLFPLSHSCGETSAPVVLLASPATCQTTGAKVCCSEATIQYAVVSGSDVVVNLNSHDVYLVDKWTDSPNLTPCT